MNIAVLGGHYLKNYRGEHTVWLHDLPLSINIHEDNSIGALLARGCPFTPDILLFGDQSCFPMVTGLEDLDIPTVAYLIDTHLHYPWHRYFAGMFDHVFVAQHDCAVSLGAYNPACEWLPLFSRMGDIRYATTKIYDITFVGTVNPARNAARVEFLNKFAAKMPLHVFSGEYVEHYNASNIILNQSVSNDINFRVFEALASGSLLLTDNVDNGFDRLFEDGRHLVVYRKGDVDDAVEKARYYLANAAEREKIAEEGHRLVVGSHTLDIRIQQILAKMTAISSRYTCEPGRKNGKKCAAGRTFLAIAKGLYRLEALHGTGQHGRQAVWFLGVAHDALMTSLQSGMADEGIIRNLALLYFLERKMDQAALHVKMALLSNPDDVEMNLLAAEIEHDRGDRARSRIFFTLARELLQQMVRNPVNSLDIDDLADSLFQCGRRLSLL